MRNRIHVFVLVLIATLFVSFNRASADPIKVVFDTDISGDVDDCGALAILNALADQGEAQILACVVNGHDADKASAAAVNAINTYYGRPDVPVGAYQGNHGTPTHSKYTAKLRDEFPHTAAADDKAPPALQVYRRALAGAPDGSVVIISVGFLMNLGDLLDSKGDDISPLAGLDLVRGKVRRLVVMGGQFPNPQGSKEWNFTFGNVGRDTQHVVENWPTPILFSGFSIGQGISTGPALEATPVANPVRRAYELYDNALKKGRSSWDPTAVLAAVRDPEKYWLVVSDGYCTVSEKGVNSWSPTPHRGHSYLAPKIDNQEMARTLGSLMALPPAHQARAAEGIAKIDPRPSIVLAIADDWSWPHAGVYGDKVVKTPTFDRVAREGVLFTRAFCAAPTCSASRASILTGQWPHRLAEGADLWGTLPARFPVYPDVLEKAGYHVGYMQKGWGPGALGDRKRNPAGNPFKSFDEFIKTVPAGEPFCFWYGSWDPHRPYVRGTGVESGMKLQDVTVPPYLPDTPEVRGDILDYYFAVERYDRDTGHIVKVLEDSGRLDNTIVAMTSDNGWPFPRAKANVYEYSGHLPLAIRWPAKVKAGRTVDHLISLTDLAPTFLQAAGVSVTEMPDMTAESFYGVLTEDPALARPARQAVFFERERHANVRKGDKSYPSRAIRTDKYLYVLNLRPDLWPAGDPEPWYIRDPFGDIDPSPTKTQMMARRTEPAFAELFRLAFGKRQAVELYDLEKDPSAVHDVSDVTEYHEAQQKLAAELHQWMHATKDPRADMGADYDGFDHFPYTGGPAAMPESKPRGEPPRQATK